MNSIGTCRNCDKRKPGCHDTCEKYLSAKARYDEKKEIERDIKCKEGRADAYFKRSCAKRKRRREK